jgi:hypothetical protein
LTQHGGAFGMLLRLVQQRRTKLAVFEQTLHEAVRALEALAEEDRQRWLELLSYIAAMIYNERDVPEREVLWEKVAASLTKDAHRREVFAMGQTIAEHLREQGRQEGVQLGEVRNQRRCLVELLRHKFDKVPATLLKQIEAAEDLKVLQVWFARVLAAKKLEHVSFADD